MCCQVVLLSKPPVTSGIGTWNFLSVLKRSARVLSFDVDLKLSLTPTFHVAKWTMSMLFANMSLELFLGNETKMYRVSPHVELTWHDTVWTEELGSSMCSLNMLTQPVCAVETSPAYSIGKRVDIGALVWGELEVFGVNMALQSMMLPKCLVAWRKSSAAEPLMPNVCVLVSLQPGGSKEALSTSFPITYKRAFVSMRALNVRLQMLLLEVCLIATFVCASKCPIVCMGS